MRPTPSRWIEIPRVLGVFLTFWWLLTDTPARADVAPPPDYVESCTVERQQTAETVCELCPASFRDRTGCRDWLEEVGYEKQCQTRGASVWLEVWCIKKEKAPASLPARKPARDRTDAVPNRCTPGDPLCDGLFEAPAKTAPPTADDSPQAENPSSSSSVPPSADTPSDADEALASGPAPRSSPAGTVTLIVVMVGLGFVLWRQGR